MNRGVQADIDASANVGRDVALDDKEAPIALSNDFEDGSAMDTMQVD
jgi:hypothetical protein